MWEANVMIQTIHVNPRYSQHDLFRRVVVIHLETNQLRPCVRVTLKAFPLAHRAKVVGRTLVSGRTDAKYAEVAFPSNNNFADHSSYEFRVSLRQLLLPLLRMLLLSPILRRLLRL
jgi:hypothetical protein